MKYCLLFLLSVSILFSCGNNIISDSTLKKEEEKNIYDLASSYYKPIPIIDWNNYTQSQKHMISLGKKLFYDKKLSLNKTQNCASCHIMEKFGVDNLRVSLGDGGEPGLRNTPTVLNASLQYAQLWDSRVKDVEEQAGKPIFGSVEMGMVDTLELINRIARSAEYQEMFSKAFLQEDTLISLRTIRESIGAFERTLLTPTRFDNFLNGDLNALNNKERKGLSSFFEHNCISCHNGLLLGGNMAQKAALYGNYWDYTNSSFLDKGRYKETQIQSDKFVFKVPQLINVTETNPYFHDGSVDDLKEAIRISALAELNVELSEEEIENIASFFNSLTGEIPDYAFEKNPFPFETGIENK